MANSNAKAIRPEVITVPEIKGLLTQAKAHLLRGQRFGAGQLEAFLMLAVLMEGVLRRLALLHLEGNARFAALRGKRRNRYGLDSAIDDLCLLDVISLAEFKSLEKFKADRNNCMHEILGMRSDAAVQDYAGKLFLRHQAIFETVLEKLREYLLTTS